MKVSANSVKSGRSSSSYGTFLPNCLVDNVSYMRVATMPPDANVTIATPNSAVVKPKRSVSIPATRAPAA